MKSGSWASYQSALPNEARAGGEPDDEPQKVGRHDHEPPYAVAVCWMGSFQWPDDENGPVPPQPVPVGRIFGAEKWRWKHILAWKAAMTRRHGYAWIEELF